MLAPSRSHDKTSQMSVPATSLSSPTRGLAAARCHNRALWACWLVLLVIQIDIAFNFQPGWQFSSDLSEQLLLNIYFFFYKMLCHLLSSEILRKWLWFLNFPVCIGEYPRKDSIGLQPHLRLREIQNLYREQRYLSKQQQRGTGGRVPIPGSV